MNAIPETIEPASPVRQRKSEYTKGMRKICGNGNQIPPSWAKPGVRLSTTLLAMFKCDSASPYAMMYPWMNEYHVAPTAATVERMTTHHSGRMSFAILFLNVKLAIFVFE